ncbi:MAG: acetyl-CoA carboxylase biotin carboxyl carrier protein [Ktedonobacteraceae bacterium]
MNFDDADSFTDEETQRRETPDVLSVEQLQRLVRLLDRSDVSELELKRIEEGTRLVLRKVRVPEPSGQQAGASATPQTQLIDTSILVQSPVSATPPVETKHTVVAHLVGIFHAAARPRGGTLVAIGDHVKTGQLVATIESLNVINEVETAVAGRVVELLVQEGQPVEYGQPLMVIDSSGGEKRT